MVLIAKRWAHLLVPGHLSMAKENAARWASAIVRKLGFNAKGCIMFVDGTEIECCRPSIWQKLLFNGHKRYHSTGWQGLMAPVGIIIQLFGPCLGSANDSYMINASRLIDILEGDFPNHYVYADLGYGLSPKIQHGFSNATATADQSLYNRLWSRVRIAVEWGFGSVKETLKTIDQSRSQKPLEQGIAVWYMVAVILRNCIVCLRGQDEVSLHFGLRPPALDEYLLPKGPRFDYWMDAYPVRQDPHMFAWFEAEEMAGAAGAEGGEVGQTDLIEDMEVERGDGNENAN